MGKLKRYDMDGSCECGRMDNDVEYESDDGEWVRGADYDALRKHAERLACVLEDARFYFSENDIYDYDRVMEISIDAYRAAYPKEDSDAD